MPPEKKQVLFSVAIGNVELTIIIIITIIMTVFRLIEYHNQNKVYPKRAKKASSIQYCYRKWGTNARAFSQTPAHVNSKKEIRQGNRGRRDEVRNVYGNK